MGYCQQIGDREETVPSSRDLPSIIHGRCTCSYVIHIILYHNTHYFLVYSNITTNELRLSFAVITALWDQLVCHSATAEERDLLYKWFSSLAANGQALTSIVT